MIYYSLVTLIVKIYCFFYRKKYTLLFQMDKELCHKLVVESKRKQVAKKYSFSLYQTVCKLRNCYCTYHFSRKRKEVGVGIMQHTTEYGHPMKPFFNDVPNFWANWADRPNKFWGIFGQTISPHFGTVSPMSMISIIQLFFLQKTLGFRPNLNISQI